MTAAMTLDASELPRERCDIRGCPGVCDFHVRLPDKSRIDLCRWHRALAEPGTTIEPYDGGDDVEAE